MRRSDVVQRLQKSFPDLQREFGVAHLSLFGSVARDEAGAQSDVDVLVELERPAGLFAMIRLQERLEQLLGCQVDVATIAGLKPRVRERALKEAVHVA